MPDPKAHTRDTPVAVPGDFLEDVERARRDGRRGDLRLLAHEARSRKWAQEGLRLIDEALANAAPDRVMLFTGHMVDAPSRTEDQRRFPPTASAEATARQLIEDAVRAEVREASGAVLGIAGGASGGDILFHEVCEALRIPTRLYLALPIAKFQVSSVQRAGADWVERYRKLCERVPPRVLQESEALPGWLADAPDYDVWQRNNLWMMFNALATEARHLTLIALYNPDRDPDGPGGTAHLVGEARKHGFRSVELDARKLLDERQTETAKPSAAFEAALPFVLRWEGGFVDHPNDPGGRTNKGVTQKVYDAWRERQGLPKRDVKVIDDAEVHAIYAAGYWYPPRCDRLQDQLDLVQFDTAVNMGVGRAVRFLQSAVGCPVDGGFGPITERAVAACDVGTTISRYCDVREAYYRKLAATRPQLAVFLKGWLNRLNALRREIGLPGYESAVVFGFGDTEFTARIPDIGEDPDYDI